MTSHKPFRCQAATLEEQMHSGRWKSLWRLLKCRPEVVTMLLHAAKAGDEPSFCNVVTNALGEGISDTDFVQSCLHHETRGVRQQPPCHARATYGPRRSNSQLGSLPLGIRCRMQSWVSRSTGTFSKVRSAIEPLFDDID